MNVTVSLCFTLVLLLSADSEMVEHECDWFYQIYKTEVFFQHRHVPLLSDNGKSCRRISTEKFTLYAIK